MAAAGAFTWYFEQGLGENFGLDGEVHMTPLIGALLGHLCARYDAVVEYEHSIRPMRGLIKTMVLKYLEIASRLHADILRVVIDAGDFKPALSEIIQVIREILPALREREIRLAIENHDRISAGEFRQIIEETDLDWVGICLDSVNSLGKGEGFFEVAGKLLPYTINLHIKDYTIKRMEHQMGFQVTGTIAGQGMLPIKWLFNEVGKYGRCHSAILELWPPPEKDVEATIRKEELWVGESISYLRGIIRR
jgi:sugar phosphate isomerase/epimerase